MSTPDKPCPGCGCQPFLDQHGDETIGRLECNNCSFSAVVCDWQKRTPGPATQAMLMWVEERLPTPSPMFRAFFDEWKTP